jgi:hypothetical protein
LNRIRAASAWADTIMKRPIPVIAYQDTEIRRMTARPDGTILVNPRNTPCLQLVSFAYGTSASNLASKSDLSDVTPDFYFYEVPLTSGFMSTAGPLQFGSVRPGRSVYCQWSHIAGWPHATLSGGASAGATSLTISAPLGVQPGMSMVVYDGAQTEQVTVSAAYAGGSSVPLASALVFAHGSGVTVSAIPEDIRQATILLASTLIQTRGAVAVLAPQMNTLAGRLTQGGSGNRGAQQSTEYVDANVKTATDLLFRYQRPPR